MSPTFSSLGIRNYRIYATGAFVSNIGTWMGRVAQDWLVLTQLTPHSSSALGIVTGLRDHVGDVGLVFIDGHEDTMPIDVSEDGEAANTELGLLLGTSGRLPDGELGERLPAMRPDRVVVLGPRDEAWRKRFDVGTLADCGVWVAPLAEVADDPAGAGRRAIERLSGRVVSHACAIPHIHCQQLKTTRTAADRPRGCDRSSGSAGRPSGRPRPPRRSARPRRGNRRGPGRAGEVIDTRGGRAAEPALLQLLA